MLRENVMYNVFFPIPTMQENIQSNTTLVYRIYSISIDSKKKFTGCWNFKFDRTLLNFIIDSYFVLFPTEDCTVIKDDEAFFKSLSLPDRNS